ncbi:inovirus Gp2 family protein [uncultured Comamonas sp.]|uniref:inovirus Gp2 family protein n=1 Tax=uncultured Comamonas sp. TaxID=114710 RepID=UPI0037495605
MSRNPFNTNQHIHNELYFQGSPVICHHGELIYNHLQRIHECLTQALELHARICVMRFDLYVPENFFQGALHDNSLISRFFSSLQSKLEHAQEKSREAGHRVHETDLKKLWTRETSENGRVHFHVAIIVNHDAFAFIGRFDLDSNNMYARIHQAWASALSMYLYDIKGYVHIPDQPTYLVIRGDEESFNEVFYRMSYFAKLKTKQYQKGFHTFGCSRPKRIGQAQLR